MHQLSNTQNVRIIVPAGGEDVVLVCRQPTGKEMSKFLSSRYIQERNKVKTRLYEARQEFIDKLLVDVENVTYLNAAGESVVLSKDIVLSEEERATWAVSLDIKPSEVDWKALIPLNWKSSAAMYFEDSAAEGN